MAMKLTHVRHVMYFICSHQMPNFSARMYQIQFRLGLCPRSIGNLTALPRPPIWWEERGWPSGVGRGGLRGAEAPPEMCEGGPCHGCGDFVG